MNSPKINTIPVVPYSLLLAFLLLIVLLGNNRLWPLGRLLPGYRNLLDVWTLYSPGQLHREVTERIRGKFQGIDTTVDWPTVKSCHLGPTVVIHDGVKRFDSGVFSWAHFHKYRLASSSILTKSPSDFRIQYSLTSVEKTPMPSGSQFRIAQRNPKYHFTNPSVILISPNLRRSNHTNVPSSEPGSVHS